MDNVLRGKPFETGMISKVSESEEESLPTDPGLPKPKINKKKAKKPSSEDKPGDFARISIPGELRTQEIAQEITNSRDSGRETSNRSLKVQRIRRVEDRQIQPAADPENQYKLYGVIEVLLVPPEDVESNVSRITPPASGAIIVRTRRYVIIQQVPGGKRFKALAIKTYNQQGVGAPGVIKSHHSIIHTGSRPPRPLQSEALGRTLQGNFENPMQPQPICVIPYDRSRALDPLSRLDYADVYEFDCGVTNMKVFGRVHEDSRAPLFIQYNAVWRAIRQAGQDSTGIRTL